MAPFMVHKGRNKKLGAQKRNSLLPCWSCYFQRNREKPSYLSSLCLDCPPRSHPKGSFPPQRPFAARNAGREKNSQTFLSTSGVRRRWSSPTSPLAARSKTKVHFKASEGGSDRGGIREGGIVECERVRRLRWCPSSLDMKENEAKERSV